MLCIQDVAALEGDVDVAALHHLPRMSDKTGETFLLIYGCESFGLKIEKQSLFLKSQFDGSSLEADKLFELSIRV
ncbi:hypothetical protein ACET3Z_014463 [Daucus carota]